MQQENARSLQDLDKVGGEDGTTGPGEHATTVFARLESRTASVEGVLTIFCWSSMFLMMLVITVDVVLRYGLNAPLSWAYDLVALYLMPVVFFFGLTDTMRHNENVAVDIVYIQLSPRMKLVCDIVIYSVCIAVFAILFYATGLVALDSFIRNETASGLIAWPLWIGYTVAPIGTFPVILLCMLRLFDRLARLDAAAKH